jgi:hypothetical protein
MGGLGNGVVQVLQLHLRIVWNQKVKFCHCPLFSGTGMKTGAAVAQAV